MSSLRGRRLTSARFAVYVDSETRMLEENVQKGSWFAIPLGT